MKFAMIDIYCENDVHYYIAKAGSKRIILESDVSFAAKEIEKIELISPQSPEWKAIMKDEVIETELITTHEKALASSVLEDLKVEDPKKGAKPNDNETNS